MPAPMACAVTVPMTTARRSRTTEFDEITAAAAQEPDPAKRVEMYAQAEEILAAEEVAYAPIYHYTAVNMTKPWLTRNFPSRWW